VLSAWLHSEPHPGPARQTTDSDARSRRYQTGSGGRTRTFMSSDQAALRHLYCSPRVDPEIMPEGYRSGTFDAEEALAVVSGAGLAECRGVCPVLASNARRRPDSPTTKCRSAAISALFSMTDHKARSEPQVIAAVTLHLKEHVADTWCPCSECGADRACCRAVTGGLKDTRRRGIRKRDAPSKGTSLFGLAEQPLGSIHNPNELGYSQPSCHHGGISGQVLATEVHCYGTSGGTCR